MILILREYKIIPSLVLSHSNPSAGKESGMNVASLVPDCIHIPKQVITEPRPTADCPGNATTTVSVDN